MKEEGSTTNDNVYPFGGCVEKKLSCIIDLFDGKGERVEKTSF
jgi:hypothetical protein